MNHTCDIVGETGLQFYGKMCASMSHEIKNALAIIQEHAGLLDDFAAMAAQGMPIKPERVKTLAEKIQGQINRANGIVKGLNRLAHSTDDPVKTVDLGEELTNMISLSHRLATRRGVAVKATAPDEPVALHTSAFFLQNLLWLCLDYSMDAVGGTKSVEIHVQPIPAGANVVFSKLEAVGQPILPAFPGEQAKALLDALGAEVEINAETKELVLTMPQDKKP